MVISSHVKKVASHHWIHHTRNPRLCTNLMALDFIKPVSWAIEVYIAGIFWLFCTCYLDLYRMTFIIQNWPIFAGDTLGVQIWTSNVKAFESYRLTDIQTSSSSGGASLAGHSCLHDFTPLGTVLRTLPRRVEAEIVLLEVELIQTYMT